MNNTRRRTLAIVVLIFTAATLVAGATTIPSASAYLQKKVAQHYDKGKHNGKGTGNTDSDTIQKCKQFASGFDPTFSDQNCDILSNSTIGQAAVTPVKLTCEQCFTKFLNADQVSRLTENVTLEELCAFLRQQQFPDFENFLERLLGISESVADQIIQCLKETGIVFPTDIEVMRTPR